jgi:Ca-activated chloride channel family protein
MKNYEVFRYGFIVTTSLLALAFFPACSTDGMVSSSPPRVSHKYAVPQESSQPQGEWSTEEYERVDENEFLSALQNPLSTFSIDVDTASYANSRRFLTDNSLPPADAVRIEEFVNYFSYDYAAPTGQAPFAVNSELSICPWNRDHELLCISLQGKKLELKDLPPNNFVFLLDVSGSMFAADKLPLVQGAMKLLTQQLRPIDRVAIVTYAGAAGLVLESTSGEDKAKIFKAIEALRAGGSTAGGQGIQLAYKVAGENFMNDGNNRIILATDGDFNVGVSSTGALTRLVEEKQGEGISLSVLGVGTGNLKESRMEKLAASGNGNFSYLDSLLEAKKALVTEFGGTMVTIAKDVKLQLEFNPRYVKSYRLIGYENRMLAAEDFLDDKKDAGDLGAGHQVTALYEIIPSGTESEVRLVPDLKYQASTVLNSPDFYSLGLRYKHPGQQESMDLAFRFERTKLYKEQLSESFTFASSVAEFGMLLKKSKHRGNASYGAVFSRAEDSKGEDAEGYRAEFLRLVEIASMLDEDAEPVTKRATHKAFKGMEMYSWQDAGTWHFSLLQGTNRRKSDTEIQNSQTAIVGVDLLKPELALLAGGESLFWRNMSSELPSDGLVEELMHYCDGLEIELAPMWR